MVSLETNKQSFTQLEERSSFISFMLLEKMLADIFYIALLLSNRVYSWEYVTDNYLWERWQRIHRHQRVERQVQDFQLLQSLKTAYLLYFIVTEVKVLKFTQMGYFLNFLIYRHRLTSIWFEPRFKTVKFLQV